MAGAEEAFLRFSKLLLEREKSLRLANKWLPKLAQLDRSPFYESSLMAVGHTGRGFQGVGVVWEPKQGRVDC